jgi:hypothetical protein
MSNPTKQLALENYKDFTPNEYEELKKHRLQRLLNGSANLQNPLFLAFRRQDWKHYLLFDVKSYEEYEQGLQYWLNEDPNGANEFKHFNGMSG